MLDHQKLVQQLITVSETLSLRYIKEQDIAKAVLEEIRSDEELCKKIHQKKYSLLLPKWQGILGACFSIGQEPIEYVIAAIDGSQIYYDKHQGPACYLLNIGTVLLEYNKVKSLVSLSSEPYVKGVDQDISMSVADYINLQRELYELEAAVNFSMNKGEKDLLILLDGTILFFMVDSGGVQDKKIAFFDRYIDCLQRLYEQDTLFAGYISFPRSKELVNIVKLALVQFQETELQSHNILDNLVDMDIAYYLLKPGQRSVLFESKAPISYLYPSHLKPYFCYMHVGYEIIRLEIPAFIAQNEKYINDICHRVFDQVKKGQGYPVCLFEAHEQAVIKGIDREFFYAMMEKITNKHNNNYYKRSIKSLKKQQVPV